MRQLYKPGFLILIMLFMFRNGFAQHQAVIGYIVNQKNDTIKCWILHQGDFAVKYELLDKDDFLKITADSIKEYESQDMQYPQVAVKIKPGKKSQFLPRLVTGIIGLYELREQKAKAGYTNYNPMTHAMTMGTTGTYESITWYAGKGNTDTLYDVAYGDTYNPGKGKGDQKNRLLKLIADNEDLVARVNRYDDNDFDMIKDILKEYDSYYSPAEDYFITQKKDTIKCSLGSSSTTYQHNSSVSYHSYTLAYRPPNAKNFIPLNVDSISEYAFKDSVLIKCNLPNSSRPRFTNRIIHGKINLYTYGLAEDPAYYASKDDAPLVEIKLDGNEPLKQRVQVLSNLIADDAPLLEQLKNVMVLNRQVVYYAIKSYNQFKNGK